MRLVAVAVVAVIAGAAAAAVVRGSHPHGPPRSHVPKPPPLPEPDDSPHPFPRPGFEDSGSAFLTRPTVIIAAGAPRTGSTWQYALLQTIAERYGVPYYADSFPLIDSRHKENFLKVNMSRTTLIVKSHRFLSGYSSMASYTFTSHRDLRDSFISIVTKNLFGCADNLPHTNEDLRTSSRTYDRCRKLQAEKHAEHVQWEQVADHNMHYESFYEDPEREIRETMRVLGIPDSPQDVAYIKAKLDEAFSSHHTLKDANDPLWFVSSEHVTDHNEPGYWKEALHNNVKNCLTAEHTAWLRKQGYEASQNARDLATCKPTSKMPRFVPGHAISTI